MVLTIDVGNSNIVVGAYEGGECRFLTRVATDIHREADQYAVELAGIFGLYKVDTFTIDGVAIASVVPGITGILTKALKHFTSHKPMVLALPHAYNLQVMIDNPAELGTDILASAIAVINQYTLPAIIIDMGTATKLTAIDAKGNLLGVSIAPGLYLSLNALITGASQLGGISMQAPSAAIGTNTPSSIRSGLLLGTASMLDGMISRFETELGGAATVISTGGAAPIVVPHCHKEIIYNETLLLDGLYQAYTHANGKA